jgi:hypothetical protein
MVSFSSECPIAQLHLFPAMLKDIANSKNLGLFLVILDCQMAAKQATIVCFCKIINTGPYISINIPQFGS